VVSAGPVAGAAPRTPVRSWPGHLTLALVAVALLAALHVTGGRLEVGGGEGWDGADYARMLREGWSHGTVITQYRPLVVWANWPAYLLLGNAVQAFDAMNYLYTFAFAVLLSLLMQHYGATLAMRAVGIVCIGLSIDFRLFAFYPVLIDLGAGVAMTLAIWCIVSNRRLAAACACVAAALAREYAPAVILFGVHRDLRQGTRLRTIAATYAPSVVAYAALRIAVARFWKGTEDGITLDFFRANLGLWTDPLFAALFLYFVVTLGAGATVVATAQIQRWWRRVREEPEWISLVLPVTLAAAFVGMDTPRYLTTLLPVAGVVFAWCASQWQGRERWVYSTAAVGLTLWARPFQRMDSARYFADWFPYYIQARQYPLPGDPPSLWPTWGWRFLIVAAALWSLAAFSAGQRARRVVS
jgi:hypothetical protein